MICLASASPRRRFLLESAGLTVEVRPSGAEETLLPGEPPVAFALRLAVAKADAVEGPLVVAADTVVHHLGRIFDKPTSRHEAAAHLAVLSGSWHAVTTGVCVRRGAHTVTFSATTAVRFRRLTQTEIDRYLATGEADDKAGAYGIQGAGGVLVAELHGSYTNVIGLPLEETLAVIETLERPSL